MLQLIFATVLLVVATSANSATVLDNAELRKTNSALLEAHKAVTASKETQVGEDFFGKGSKSGGLKESALGIVPVKMETAVGEMCCAFGFGTDQDIVPCYPAANCDAKLEDFDFLAWAGGDLSGGSDAKAIEEYRKEVAEYYDCYEDYNPNGALNMCEEKTPYCVENRCYATLCRDDVECSGHGHARYAYGNCNCVCGEGWTGASCNIQEYRSKNGVTFILKKGYKCTGYNNACPSQGNAKNTMDWITDGKESCNAYTENVRGVDTDGTVCSAISKWVYSDQWVWVPFNFIAIGQGSCVTKEKSQDLWLSGTYTDACRGYCYENPDSCTGYTGTKFAPEEFGEASGLCYISTKEIDAASPVVKMDWYEVEESVCFKLQTKPNEHIHQPFDLHSEDVQSWYGEDEFEKVGDWQCGGLGHKYKADEEWWTTMGECEDYCLETEECVGIAYTNWHMEQKEVCGDYGCYGEFPDVAKCIYYVDSEELANFKTEIFDSELEYECWARKSAITVSSMKSCEKPNTSLSGAPVIPSNQQPVCFPGNRDHCCTIGYAISLCDGLSDCGGVTVDNRGCYTVRKSTVLGHSDSGEISWLKSCTQNLIGGQSRSLNSEAEEALGLRNANYFVAFFAFIGAISTLRYAATFASEKFSKEEFKAIEDPEDC